ncbi:hypothetical protein QE152_g35077 [Popillia japonica]|uniref:DDE-1 domain-containing protein n=1 Tax=Popillia japonica TaxID=7064 RepID=A0AAW1ISS6_POPJA
MSKNISVLSAIHMLSKAWNNVSEDCIRNCFLKCKFGVCVTSDVVLQPEDDLPVAPEGMNEEDFCRYAELDNDVAVFEDNDDEEKESMHDDRVVGDYTCTKLDGAEASIDAEREPRTGKHTGLSQAEEDSLTLGLRTGKRQKVQIELIKIA